MQQNISAQKSIIYMTEKQPNKINGNSPSISSDFSVSDKLNASSEIPIYSKIPKRYKLNYHQFEVLVPLLTEYDTLASSFGAFDKKEVFVEFSTYHEYILNNFEHEFQHVLFGDEDLYEYASAVSPLFNMLSIHIERVSNEDGNCHSIKDVHETITAKFKHRFGKFLEPRKQAMSKLWQSFLLNIAILNIKSVILCGEYAKNKLRFNNKQVVPIKFIPKLGSELDILFKLDTFNLNDIKTRINNGTLLSPYGRNVYISSLPSSEIVDIMDYNLEGNQIYVPEIAEKYGYTRERYEEAEHTIRTRATKSEEELESCELYLNEILDFIDALGALYSELEAINKNGNCIITDFNCISDYAYQKTI